MRRRAFNTNTRITQAHITQSDREKREREREREGERGRERVRESEREGEKNACQTHITERQRRCTATPPPPPFCCSARLQLPSEQSESAQCTVIFVFSIFHIHHFSKYNTTNTTRNTTKPRVERSFVFVIVIVTRYLHVGATVRHVVVSEAQCQVLHCVVEEVCAHGVHGTQLLACGVSGEILWAKR